MSLERRRLLHFVVIVGIVVVVGMMSDVPVGLVGCADVPTDTVGGR